MVIKIDQERLSVYNNALKRELELFEIAAKKFRNIFAGYHTWHDNIYVLLGENMNYQIDEANKLIDMLHVATKEIDNILELLQPYFDSVSGLK